MKGKGIKIEAFLLMLILILVGCQKDGTLNALGSVAQNAYTRVQDLVYGTMNTNVQDATKEVVTPASGGAVGLGESYDVPLYEGRDYVDIHGDKNALLTKGAGLEPGQYILSEWDELGRCGPAILCANKNTIPSSDRESTGQAKPSGWVQNKYPGIVKSEPPYLYNRAHLLMWALSGLTDDVKNLITGTRHFNTECMLPTEMEVLNTVKSGKTVIYEVTPIFKGDNLLADGVIMEAVSTDGSFYVCRYAFNVQPGITLDYETGKNWIEGQEVKSEHDGPVSFVLNTGTKRFHKPDCKSVTDMKPANKKEFFGTRKEVINNGYTPCGACTP